MSNSKFLDHHDAAHANGDRVDSSPSNIHGTTMVSAAAAVDDAGTGERSCCEASCSSCPEVEDGADQLTPPSHDDEAQRGALLGGGGTNMDLAASHLPPRVATRTLEERQRLEAPPHDKATDFIDIYLVATHGKLRFAFKCIYKVLLLSLC